MMNPIRQTRVPFWNYTDLLILAGLIFPCLVAGLGVAQLYPQSIRVWVGQLLFYLLWICCFYFVLKVRYFDESLPQGLAWFYPRRGLIVALAAGPLLAITVGFLGALLRTPLIDTPFRKLLHGQGSIFLFGVFSVLLGPFVEELVFRGFMMPLFSRTFGIPLGILLAALPFGLMHGPQYGWLWQPIVLVTFTGVIFGIVRQWTGSTLASAAMHSAYNLTVFAYAVVSGELG